MIHAQAPTKALAWKVVQLFDQFVLYGQTDTITRNSEPLFKLVLWFVLGRGSIHVSSMIHSVRSTVPAVVTISFTLRLFWFAIFWKVGTDGRTDGSLCEYNDHYRPGLWINNWVIYTPMRLITSHKDISLIGRFIVLPYAELDTLVLEITKKSKSWNFLISYIVRDEHYFITQKLKY